MKIEHVLLKVLQENRTNGHTGVCRRGHLLLQELAYAVMEARKPHILPSANWRTRRASVSFSKFQGQRSSRAGGVTPSLRSKT